MFVLCNTFFEVDVGKSIKLVHHNIDIVGAYSCRQNRNPFALVGACMCYELTVLNFALYIVEVLGNQCNTSWITDKNHIISKLFGQKMKVKNTAVGINN